MAYIFLLAAAVLVCGCGTKKKAVNTSPAAVATEPETPSWHTCLIRNARGTITMDDATIAANVTMQTVRDSMIVISVMPLPGIEIARFEATPVEVTGFNKIDGTYATATYAEVNRNLVPNINWDMLQQLCSAELPTGDKRARLYYTLGEKTIELVVDYPPRQTDVPVRAEHQRTDRYKKVNITKWL
ncbi:MAG: DUF4292 domain-containing protein [Paludibacteraceae bacterium]|nr:DUF4292 domain-containing protein [Paludibacteraceae bacterium]